MIHRLALQLLRRHVCRCARCAAQLERFGRTRHGQVKIHQPHISIPGHHHVLRFEVQMHEATVMDVLETDGHIDQNITDEVR